MRPLLGIPTQAAPAEAGARLREVVASARTCARAVAAAPRSRRRGDAAPSDEVDALDDEFRAERTIAVIGDLIRALTEGPGCLVIDDAQWVDPASAAVLAACPRSDGVHAIFVARRDEAGGLELAGDTLDLEGLGDDDAGDLIEAVAGRRMLPADLAPLISRARRKPALPDRAGVGNGDGRRVARHRAAHRRAHRHPERERSRDPPQGRRCSAPASRSRSTCRAWACRSCRPGCRSSSSSASMPSRFRSELFRDVAYDQLTFQARRELHRAAAAAITADPSLGGASRDVMLAAHYEAAGDWDAARDAAERSAASAEKAFALEEAVRGYRTAVEAARRSARVRRRHPGPAGVARPRERRRRLGRGGPRGVLERPQAHHRHGGASAPRPQSRVRAQRPRAPGRGRARAARGPARDRRVRRRRRRCPRGDQRHRGRAPAPAVALGGRPRARPRSDRAAREVRHHRHREARARRCLPLSRHRRERARGRQRR